ncbi:hypothetical protein [Nocardioides sp. KR10-350]|uniref:hypothetical protein n=1 Tax=Nocardioides cheoyonin TaxID=3156615 RepID=UPI0032B5E3BC
MSRIETSVLALLERLLTLTIVPPVAKAAIFAVPCSIVARVKGIGWAGALLVPALVVLGILAILLILLGWLARREEARGDEAAPETPGPSTQPATLLQEDDGVADPLAHLRQARRPG